MSLFGGIAARRSEREQRRSSVQRRRQAVERINAAMRARAQEADRAFEAEIHRLQPPGLIRPSCGGNPAS